MATSPDWDVDDVLDGCVPISEILADCLAGRPGAGRIQMIANIDPVNLDGAAQIDYLRVLEQQIRWLQSRQLKALTAIAAADTSPEQWSGISVARAMDLSDPHAAATIFTARTLIESLPSTVQFLGEGRISHRHAEAILDTSRTINSALHAQLEASVLTRAQSQTVPELRRSLNRVAIRLDAQAAETRRQLANADRCVQRRPIGDGMAEFRAVLPAHDAEALWVRLDAATKLLPCADTRTLDQQRADLLVDAVLTGLPHDSLPQFQGRQPTIGVVIELSTLLGLNDEPGDLAGHGAITAKMAREIAADPTASWHRFVTEPVTGHLLDYGQACYRPPQQLKDFIINRAPTCVHPGCRRPSYRSELDHRRPFESGGHTSSENLHPLCRRHHMAKTHGGWSYRCDGRSEPQWRSPTGHEYQVQQEHRWRSPADVAVLSKPITTDALPAYATATAAERQCQRAQEAARDHPGYRKAVPTASPADTAARSERLQDYLDSLRAAIPPF